MAEFVPLGFDSSTTPESGIRAQVLRLSSFCDVITVWLKRCTLCVELTRPLIACLRVFILPPCSPFQVQPPAFYTLVAEFEARGFESTPTSESGYRTRVL